MAHLSHITCFSITWPSFQQNIGCYNKASYCFIDSNSLNDLKMNNNNYQIFHFIFIKYVS